ncbi:efflux RND transporter periplasmic adaptor subunit [Thalassotalea sp. PS06]|nr:efflux RND transporter periplasmic adaptor subunit [Thalassotalea sp. PS06]
MLAIPSSFAAQTPAPRPAPDPELGQQSVFTEEQVQYICPMHSHIVKDHPGKCPICGMDLVAKSVKGAGNQAEAIEVNISGAIQQNLALTTQVADKSVLWRYIETFGSIVYDEQGQQHLHPRASGWIENLAVNTLAQPVKRGQLLYEIYSPDLLLAQDEYLSLYRDRTVSDALKQRGRNRLTLLGIADSLIDKIEKDNQSLYRVPYYSPGDGIVANLDIRQGMYVNPEDEIMMLADPGKLWVIADVFEHQIDWVKTGKWVEFDLPALGIFATEGKIEYIYPELDAATRTLKVRLSLNNPDGLFKPNMIANVRIYGGATEPVLNIPLQALIQTEKQNRVVVQRDDLTFAIINVTVGIITQGRAEITSGLKPGDRIVTSGQFLIDSEANIQGSMLRLTGEQESEKSPMANPHQHH